MQKEGQNNIYTIVKDYIPSNAITKKNGNKSWLYGYNEQYDVIIISDLDEIPDPNTLNEIKNEWIIIINNFKKAGFQVTNKKEKVRIFEEYIGAYDVENYSITADNIEIKFFPVGTIVIGAFGRVNMILPNETVKLVLHDWNDWRIVSGFGSTNELIEFNEESIVKLFQDNL